MNMIPEDLLEQFERGNVLVLIGEGVNRGILPSSQELARELAEHCDYPAQEHSLARVASYYELMRNRRELLNFLRAKLGISSEIEQRLTQSEIYRLLTQLEVAMIVTTCVDQLLARALVEAQIEYTSVFDNTQIVYGNEGQLLLVNLFGLVNQPDSLIVTEDDQRRFLRKQANLSDVLRGELARRTLLLIGFDASDQWFVNFYDQVTHTLDRHHRPTYILGSELDPLSRVWWQRHNAEILDVEIKGFLLELTQELAARKPPTEPGQEASALPLPERPYKFLDYYEAKDARIFYGREQEIQQLCALIHAHRLVLLHGISGVGKTSLLLAGAVPRLEGAASPYKAIYVRALEDPTEAIRRTLGRLLPDADLPQDGSLVDFLVAVTNRLEETLLIILDQFEEFFIRLSPEFRAAFIKELGDVYDARDVPVKVLFSLREDWLGAMDEIEKRIPDIFRTRMRVASLTSEQAQEAITGPVEQLGISYEPALLERLLADLLGGSQKVMPPQLQLVCNALYEAREEDEKVIKLALYEQLGGIQGLLGKYLEEELSRLEPDEQALARAILEELITSEGTKAVKDSGQLALGLDLKRRRLVPLLEWLVQRRLLRALKKQAGLRAYELAHEYLIQEISLSTESQARKEAEELIQQEVENWRRFRTVLGADKLAVVNQQRDVLRISDDAQALLLQSALQVGQDVDYWLLRISDVTQRVELLSQASRSRLAVVRQRAVEALGSQDVLPSVEPLVTAALHDSSSAVRDAACESLAQLTTQHATIVERLMDSMAASESENGTGSTRTAVLRTLTYLPLSDLSLSLRIQVLMMRIGLSISSLIQAISATPQRRTMATTSALLVLLIVLAYMFSANSYSVDSKASRIAGEDAVIVIRQGHPELRFPGFHDVVVDSGIGRVQVKTSEDWSRVEGKELWWLSLDTADGDFDQWGQDVAEKLKLEHRAPMLWHLEEQDQAFDAILEVMASQESRSQLRAAQLLEQVVRVEPERAKAYLEIGLFDALLSLLEHQKGDVRVAAASAVGQIAETYPELVTEQAIGKLLSLLEDQKSDENSVRARAAVVSALGQMAKANLLLAEQVIDTLLTLLSDKQSQVSSSVVSALAEMAEANPELAQQVITTLLPLLKDDQKSDARRNAISTVRQVVEANPQLAQQVIDSLLSLLEDQDSDIRQSAVFAIEQVVKVNPIVAQQVIDPLLSLLKEDKNDDVRANVTSALGHVVEANPELAQQVIKPLLELLEDRKWVVGDSAASAVGQVGKANPEFAQQVIDALLLLLKGSNTLVYDNAVSAIGQVGEANPELGAQVIDVLLPLLDDTSVRYWAASAVGQVVEANPELGQQVINALLPLSKDDGFYQASVVGEVAIHLEKPEESVSSLFLYISNGGYFSYGDIAPVVDVLNDNSYLVREEYVDEVFEIFFEESNDFDGKTRYPLGNLLVNNPEHIEKVISLLREQLESSDTNSDGMSMLSYAYIHEEPDTLLEKLADPDNTLERAVAARALFLIMLREPEQETDIRQELQKLSDSREPMVRIWANKTLMMLDLVAKAHNAAELNGTELEEAINELKTLCEWDDYSGVCDTTDSSGNKLPNFFGEDFTWAIEEIIHWLEEQK